MQKPTDGVTVSGAFAAKGNAAAPVLVQGQLSLNRSGTHMLEKDERLRDTITDTFTQLNIDARNLAVEVVNGAVIIKGTVPSQDALDRLNAVLAEGRFGTRPIARDVRILPTVPRDSTDGRGRSPVTGTSADSAHESRHQLDKS